MKQWGPQQWPLCYPLSTWPTSHWRSEARMQRLHMLQKKQRKILILLWNLWLWMSVLHWLSWQLLEIFLPLKPMLLPLNGHWGQPLSQILRLAVLCPQIPLNAIFHMHIVPLQQSHLHPRPPWELQLQQKQQGIAQAKAPWQLSHPEEQMHLMRCLRKWSVTCSHHMIQIPAFLATWIICRSMMRTRIVWRLRVHGSSDDGIDKIEIALSGQLSIPKATQKTAKPKKGIALVAAHSKVKGAVAVLGEDSDDDSAGQGEILKHQ